jgi:hypothetical protein
LILDVSQFAGWMGTLRSTAHRTLAIASRANAHSEVPPVVVRNERRPSAGLAGHRVRESGRTGVKSGVADRARTSRRSSEGRCLDGSEPDVVKAPLVNVVKRFGVQVP